MYLEATLCETKDTRKSYGLLFLRTYIEHAALDYFLHVQLCNFEIYDVCVIFLRQKVFSSRWQLCIDTLYSSSGTKITRFAILSLILIKKKFMRMRIDPFFYMELSYNVQVYVYDAKGQLLRVQIW